jgi:3-hydroxyisobutyrate dehydrogenase
VEGSDKRRIAFMGLGNMGLGMACKLAESGYEIAVWNRTRSKGEEAEKLGARIADTPADAARDAEVLMLSLADQHVVETVLFGDDGAMESLPKGSHVVDMSTVPPKFAEELAGRAAQEGYKALDACVFGAPFHARQGELRVMVGGAAEDVEALADILDTIGRETTHLGANGMGATMKLVLNMLMGIQMPALAEAVVFGERAGLPRDKILQMINGTGYSSPVMNFRCPMIGERNFDNAMFRLGLMRKDMMLVLERSQELSVPMPVTESAYAMLTAAKAMGLGELDVAAIVALQERMSGMTDYPWPGEGDGPTTA